MRSTTRRKLSWLVISSLVAIAILLASCAPATKTTTQQPTTTTQQPTVTTTTTTTTQQPTTTTTETKTTGPATLAPEVPKYGGIFTRSWTGDPLRFDMYWAFDAAMAYYQEPLVIGDWMKGPTGTNEISWAESAVRPYYVMSGGLAESWDIPDPKTIIYHIRKGVHFGLNPDSEASRLVNGREFVADDVIKSWERWYSNPASYISTTIPRSGITDMYAADKYTVVLRFKKTPDPGKEFESRLGWAHQLNWFMLIEAPEVAKKYGDARDWRNAVGTGPYFLIDYIPGSMLTYKRNPNYWMNDPAHPENRLPYVGTVKLAIIPDLTTRLAALRTGKIDHTMDVPWEDGERLNQTNPELKYVTAFSTIATRGLSFKVNDPSKPYYKKEVRQALTMAIDFAAIKNNIYGGHAAYPAFPIAPLKEYIDMGAYIPLDKLPADIQALFSYNPTKAKQMLADAGYPNGFKTVVYAQAIDSDSAQLVKAYWADVGVELEIQLKEPAVYATYTTMHTQPELLFTGGLGTYPFNLLNFLPADWHNYGDYTGPEMSPKALELDEKFFDPPVMAKIFADFSLHLYDLALYINMPLSHVYTFWQPWVQNYRGERGIGHNTAAVFEKYIWIDMNLKKAMGR
ncbi:MAG: ABC transporter substrate-binding protein [Chloroflexi bacterium]|nr:ABC transporter substrate-binding protein [Chloroflexota bacterium]